VPPAGSKKSKWRAAQPKPSGGSQKGLAELARCPHGVHLMPADSARPQVQVFPNSFEAFCGNLTAQAAAPSGKLWDNRDFKKKRSATRSSIAAAAPPSASDLRNEHSCVARRRADVPVRPLCPLFQLAWLREFRLVFGASTPASAAVLAIFMGRLGLGNAILGRRADVSERPLRMYALLELLISLTSFATPFLIDLVRMLYVALGGQQTLGLTAAERWPALRLQYARRRRGRWT